ncbi:antigenic cell wall galactomannoprotein, putative [Talaromyces stipitatus ATCC 10500]|uniref:Antigenic cell wall galactomannoprotein, putative n=1 Tax=Talaromyces stipitatus (strain ATCC 10500 / CBS 375.48 / QM 6759 / NRRL 1006) TaxID=441959 RepID=B8LWR4_TALSN|nr:antigenic cell wall galactomannoprotein, putative [Talaromyces stipitatus ATCC 10500]EED24461.1 antigenic cell wall galactomannoprotein, putative [Talaromyces stipitatus ATCC 10500]
MKHDCDVLVVGAGPVGLTLALLLGSYGHRIIVLERHAAIYPLPRAVNLSHDVLRVWDGLGLYYDLFESAVADVRGTVSDEVEIIGASGQVLRRVPYNGPSKTGTSRTFRIHQPALEKVLETACQKRGIAVIRSTEVENVLNTDSHVEVSAQGPSGIQNWLAQFAVGCDGANSLVRRSVGFPFIDCPGSNTTWLVVDVAPTVPGAGEKWKDFHNARVHMNPQRPHASVFGTPQRRRWELMLLSDEEIAKASDSGFIWSLIAEFGCNPENALIEKSAAFSSKGGWCETFNKGRILLAGDAAHVTPTFIGQGLNSGVRDANSLSWRIDLALRYPESNWCRMFEDWTSERSGGVQELIKASVAMEARVTVTDLEQAMRRDVEYNQRPFAPQNPEKLGSPGMYALNSEEGEAFHDEVGSLFIDGTLQIGDRHGRLCDHFGVQSWLIFLSPVGESNSKTQICSDIIRRFSVVLNGKIVSIGNDIHDTTGVFSAWFMKYGALGVLLRPDHYIYGVARTATGLESLVRDALCHLGLLGEETVTLKPELQNRPVGDFGSQSIATKSFRRSDLNINMLLLKTIAFFPLITLTLSSPLLSKRDEASVLTGIQKIANATITLNNTVASYPGGIEGTITAVEILSDSFAVINAIVCTTNDAKHSANFTDAESESVAEAFIATLVPVVESSLATIESKKADFEDGFLGIASLTSLVETILKEIKSDSDDLATAIIAKLTSTWASVAPLIVAEIDDAFDKAIATFAS